ncbi:MAG TPA: T9SS type A sorting domain-containing protein [Hymenobacter sp.]|uniref:T9SS type A sorting domain-containing protein n=1 Tax=Hymenobacter sp. TaxID=1898978 RepID=UPI002D807354|nr:T9SS type A sorting domain-containing protein [Hymenobacter sp.]HET9503373.1 T9SS type A sorting domain-containing protein [Hymenobacter sp.]
MQKYFLLFVALVALALPGRAQTTPNFSEHIAPLIYNHCARCHRPGEVAPFSLLSYQDVASRGLTIKAVTGSGYMPPWKPDPNYRHYLDENVLSTAEVALIKNWVDGGMPQGNPALAPPVPTFPSGSQLGTPDLVVPMAQKFTIPGNNQDLYRVFVLPVTLAADKDVAAIEFRPGNKSLVHHSIIGLDTTNQGAVLDAAAPGYGYTSFGGFGFMTVEDNFAGWVPGAQARFYPTGLGKKLYKKARLLVQVHYGPTSVAQTDSSVLNIFYSRQPVARYVQTLPAIQPWSGLTNGPFVIPANQVKTFHFSLVVPQNVSALSVLPHSHLLAKKWKIWAVKPNGDTIKLAKIDSWNFRWQGNYRFLNMQKIPAGARLEADVTYDNTANNPRQPNSPPQTVQWGENTTDEMLLGYFDVVPYLPGDESVALATRAVVPVGAAADDDFLLHPNPAELGAATASFTLLKAGPVSLRLLDQNGRLVRQVLTAEYQPAGPRQVPLPLQELAAGVYLVQLEAGGRVRVGKLLVQ